MHVKNLTCFSCGQEFASGQLLNLCDCGKPLRVNYDLSKAGSVISPASLVGRSNDIWRYKEVLPVPEGHFLSLGEGGTPLVRSKKLNEVVGLEGGEVLIKDESLNPTGSFKARGMAVAVAMAKALGATKLAVPSAGNAGGALAAYSAAYGLEAHVFMPRDVPMANRLECSVFGAHVTLVDGLINDCAKAVQERKQAEGWFDLSTLREPYRVEGKKTMGYELAEQLNWELPDSIIYPTGGGTGLIGMWKAFDEMEEMGWIGSKRPKMFSVQAVGCAPVVHAFEAGAREGGLFENAHTIAAGLRVPRAIGDFIMLELIRSSGGSAIGVSDEALMAEAYVLGAASGVAACPEGGACLAALKQLVNAKKVGRQERIVIFNTGTGAKYGEAFAAHPRIN